MRLLSTLFFLLPTLATAQGFSTELFADLNGDGIVDEVNLVEDLQGGSASLNIILRKSTGSEKLVVHARSLVWVGSAMAGQQPVLRMTDHGSLQVVSMNEAIGRDRWHQTLTIAYRGGDFMLAGYTYDWYDTLNLADQGMCDINLLNGKGEMHLGAAWTKSTFTTKLRAVPVVNWSGDIPKVCLNALN